MKGIAEMFDELGAQERYESALFRFGVTAAERTREWKQQNPERAREHTRVYRRRHRDERVQYTREYRARNRDLVRKWNREAQRRRRARLKAQVAP